MRTSQLLNIQVNAADPCRANHLSYSYLSRLGKVAFDQPLTARWIDTAQTAGDEKAMIVKALRSAKLPPH